VVCGTKAAALYRLGPVHGDIDGGRAVGTAHGLAQRDATDPRRGGVGGNGVRDCGVRIAGAIAQFAGGERDAIAGCQPGRLGERQAGRAVAVVCGEVEADPEAGVASLDAGSLGEAAASSCQGDLDGSFRECLVGAHPDRPAAQGREHLELWPPGIGAHDQLRTLVAGGSVGRANRALGDAQPVPHSDRCLAADRHRRGVIRACTCQQDHCPPRCGSFGNHDFGKATRQRFTVEAVVAGVAGVSGANRLGEVDAPVARALGGRNHYRDRRAFAESACRCSRDGHCLHTTGHDGCAAEDGQFQTACGIARHRFGLKHRGCIARQSQALGEQQRIASLTQQRCTGDGISGTEPCRQTHAVTVEALHRSLSTQQFESYAARCAIPVRASPTLGRIDMEANLVLDSGGDCCDAAQDDDVVDAVVQELGHVGIQRCAVAEQQREATPVGNRSGRQAVGGGSRGGKQRRASASRGNPGRTQVACDREGRCCAVRAPQPQRCRPGELPELRGDRRRHCVGAAHDEHVAEIGPVQESRRREREAAGFGQQHRCSLCSGQRGGREGAGRMLFGT